MSDQKTTLKVVSFSGSLRKGSINTAALRALKALAPADLAIDIFDLSEIPLYNDDLRTGSGYPASVQSFRDALKSADGVLIATPEYNFSVPGGLKNMLDWTSRGADHPWAQKPVAMLSASPGPLGGARVQYELRKVMLYLNAMALTKPEIFIAQAETKFDADGRCTDATTRKFVGDQMTAFERWIAAVGRMRAAG